MKRALVTGGSGDLGSTICRRLGQQGFRVLVHGNTDPEAAARVAAGIGDAGGCADSICFDLTDAEASRSALEQALEAGPIQVVVHNAGVHRDAPLAGMEWEAWRSVIDVSLHGFYHSLRPLLLPMLATRWGRVVAISSVAALAGNRGQSNYAAAKSGLHGAVKSLAIELASRGVTVNAVAPGIIAGRMSEAAFPPERIRQMVPMQRAGTPDEVASLVGYLVSEEAGYLSGQVISVNGAMR